MIKKSVPSIVALLGLTGMSALAGTATWDFNSDPTTGTAPLTLLGSGDGGGDWVPYDGATGGSTDGYLSITGPSRGQWAKVFFPDIDPGKVIKAFTFECKLRIGNGSSTPADGFSINYARSSDPTFTKDADGNYQQGGWSGTVNEQGSVDGSMAGLPEEGTITGLAVGFDAYNSDSALWPADINGTYNDAIGISVRVDNKIVAQVPLSSVNGACDDVNSLQTGPLNADGDSSNFSDLCWKPFKVQLTEDQHLSVWWKGRAVVDNLAVNFVPGSGRLVFGGRTGDLYQNQHIDDITLTTIGADTAQVSGAIADAWSVTATIDDSGDSAVDASTVTMTVDGVAVTPLTVTKTGTSTTAKYTTSNYFTSGQQLAVVVNCKDTRGVAITGNATATVAEFATIPTAYKNPTVDTSKPGFLLRPYQTAAVQPNSLAWTEEQLIGIHGANLANLTGASGGYLTYTSVLNFNQVSDDGSTPTEIGNFTATNGNADAFFPGFPGTTGSTGNSTEEALTYLYFPTAGLYQLGVNSDDGFRVTAGRAPGDVLGTVLGAYDGGRGSSDTIFSVLVTEAGYYPIRLIYENGNGEVPDNGMNLEFFSVKDGVKTLINGTGANAIKAYRAATAYPAAVTSVSPVRGATAVFSDVTGVITIADGPSEVLDPASVVVQVAGQTVPSTVTKSGSVSTVKVPAPVLLPGETEITATVIFAAQGSATKATNNWSFTTLPMVAYPTDLASTVGSGNSSTPGFTVKVRQAEQVGSTFIIGQMTFFEQILAGIVGPNMADLSGATGGVFTYPDTINWNTAFDSATAGNFDNDVAVPGLPGSATRDVNANTAVELTTYVEFPTAGYYVIGVTSDDGFRLSARTNAPASNGALVVSSPSSVAGSYYAVTAGRNQTGGSGLDITNAISGKLVYADPAIADTALKNADAIKGNIALVDRGSVNFSLKMQNALNAGAIAIVLVNNKTDADEFGIYPIVAGGDQVDFPAVMISMPDGDKIKAALSQGVNVTLSVPDYDPGLLQFDGTRGTEENVTGLNVAQAGVYPLRLLYMNSGGAGSLELFTLNSDGTKTLVNDTTSSKALKAYRTRTYTPVATKPALSWTRASGNLVITYTGVLQSAATVNGTYTDVAGATSPATLSTTSGSLFYRARSN